MKDEMRMPRENIVLLTEDPSMNPALVNGKATKAELAKAFDGLVAKVPADGQLLVFLIGHGSFDGVDYKGPTPPLPSSRAGWTASRNAAWCWSAAHRAAEY